MGSSGGSSNTVQTVKLPPQIARQIDPFIRYTQAYVNRPFVPYTDPLVADFSPDDLRAFARTRQDVRQPFNRMQLQYFNQVRQGVDRPFNPDQLRYFRNVRRGVERPFTADDLNYFRRVRGSEFLTERANPFFEKQLDIGRRRLGEEYAERIAPQLASQYAISNAFGGAAHQEAVERSQRQLARGLQEYEVGARSEEVERRRRERFLAEARLGEIGATQRQRRDEVLDRLNRAGLQQTVRRDEVLDRLNRAGLQQTVRRDQLTAALGGIGDKRRQLAQQKLNAAYGQFIRQQDYPDKLFNAYQSAFAALTGGSPTTTTTTKDADVDAGTAAQQTIGTAASTAALGYLAYLAMGFCWVAEELYGPLDRRTHLARLWVARTDNRFTRAYKRHGKRWAAYLRKHPWQKPLWKLIWDKFVEFGQACLPELDK